MRTVRRSSRGIQGPRRTVENTADWALPSARPEPGQSGQVARLVVDARRPGPTVESDGLTMGWVQAPLVIGLALRSEISAHDVVVPSACAVPRELAIRSRMLAR
jgi:alkylation response protein AidB-like acyl-CoA dehydrogenase